MIVQKQGSLLSSTADIIAHQVSCQGAMGAGLAKQIKNKFPFVFSAYQQHCQRAKQQNVSLLGTVQTVYVPNTRQYVANLFAQEGYEIGERRTDYEALEKCFKQLSTMDYPYLSIAFPDHLGCGLAGGDWAGVVYPLIEKYWKDSEQVLEIWKLN